MGLAGQLSWLMKIFYIFARVVVTSLYVVVKSTELNVEDMCFLKKLKKILSFLPVIMQLVKLLIILVCVVQ